MNRSRQYHRYFTLYDVASLATFDSSEYVDLLEHPTPWSATMRPDFSYFLRTICTVITTRGTDIGAAISVLCVPPETHEASLRSVLDEAANLPRVNAVHDASVMPLVPSANTTAAVLMIAERASDLILGQESVPQAETAEALP